MPESEEMVARSCVLDSHYRYYKAYALLMDMIPALKTGNLKDFGRLNWEFQFAGTHTSMIQAYRDRGLSLLKAMHILRDAGADVVGMSSVGPAIYALSEDPSRLAEQCHDNGYGCRVFALNNIGMTRED